MSTTNPGATEAGTAAIQAEVLARFMRFRLGLPPALREPLDTMLRRKRYLLVDPLPDYFGLEATPFMSLPVAIAADLGQGDEAPGDQRMLTAVEAAFTGYLLIRIHDDFCDEAIGEGPTVLLLATTLQARLAQLLGEIAPGSTALLSLQSDIFTRYADAMLHEHQLIHAEGITTRAALERVLDRYLPMVLPAAAQLFAAGADTKVAPLIQAVLHLGASAQLLNDTGDVEADLERGLRGFVVCRYAPEGDLTLLRRRLWMEDGFKILFEEAAVEAGKAREQAERAGLGAVATLFRKREQHVAGRYDAMFAAISDSLVRGG